MKNLDNAKKQKSGQVFQETLEAKFSELMKSGVILSCERNKNYGHSDFEYQTQYLANFVLKTIDEKFIIVRSSNSFRGDRVKTPYWDIQGILENSEISKDIVSTVLLYPDKAGEQSEFIRRRSSIEKGTEYSPVSHIFLLTEFLGFLDNYKEEFETAIEDAALEAVGEIVDVSAQVLGSEYGKGGIKFEKYLISVLKEQSNLEQFKSSQLDEADPFQQIMGTICNCEEISRDQIEALEATDTVPLLRSGGNPKSDIVVEVFHRGKVTKCTLSVKKSTQDRVSCHDYRVADFVRVLECAGDRLELYLRKFQTNPSYQAFNDAMEAGESIEEFEGLMRSKEILLTEWALMGAHDVQNITSEDVQISKYLFVSGKNGTFCQPMDRYIDHLFGHSTLTFGAPFSWTYPSKQRGKRIQLKVPLVYFPMTI